MLTIKSLRVDYENVTAVNDLNLEIPQGQIYGLVGPNGAGKTSTIKAVAGVLEPTYGEIKIDGNDLDLDHEKAMQSIGYMPDFPPMYENLKVWEYCDVFAAAYLIPRAERLKRCEHWVAQVNLTGKWDSYIRELSRGMRQRLVLAKTLLPNPKVLLLDEPASGLDPIARREFRDLLKKVAGDGMTVMISSHILTELSDFCNAVGIMEKGRMVVSGSVADIRAQIGSKGKLTVRLATKDTATREKLLACLNNVPFLHQPQALSDQEFQAAFSGTEDDAARLLITCMTQNIPVCDFHIKEENIEDIFFKIGAKEVS